MAINFKNWFKRNKINGDAIAAACFSVAADYHYKSFALECCVNLISNALSRTEFSTYESGREVKKENYYLFNVKPNQNQSAAEFWKKAVSQLLRKGKCLIIQHNDMLYVADDFSITPYALYENIFTSVKIGDLTFDKSFVSSDVFYIEPSQKSMAELFNSASQKYCELMSAAINSYNKSNSRRATLEVDSTWSQTPEKTQELTQLLNTNYKKFLEAQSSAILPLTKGFEYNEKDFTNQTSKDSRDINHLFNDILGLSCLAFGIPRSIFSDSIVGVEKVTENLLIFGINPIANMIADEINAIYYTKSQFLGGNYVRAKTQSIKTTDIVSVATGADTLFRVGFSVNDILREMGLPTIPEKWADEHYVTKNYHNVLDREGGENTGNNKNANNQPGRGDGGGHGKN